MKISCVSKIIQFWGKHKGISEWQKHKITKPEIRIEIKLSRLMKWMHSKCNKTTKKCQQGTIFINVTA